MTKRRLAFIKSGSFSHINASLRGQLATQFSGLEVDEIDVWRDIVASHRGAYLVGLAQAVLCYKSRVLADRHSISQFAVRAPYLFRKVRTFIARRLDRHAGEYLFSLQSQSLFDASIPGIPHFVFTDHTHLANLSYPAFRRENLLPQPWPPLEREIYNHARHIFVMSEHVRSSLCEDYGVDPSRVTTVFGGSNVDPSSAPLENDGYRNRTVVFVGVDWERKGGPALAAAFSKLRASVPDARLVVVGCRPALGQSWCEEIGRVPPNEVKRHLLRASVFCLPTRIEPFGIAVIEAFSHRLPAVVSSVGAMPTLVRHGESGLVVPPDDPEALAFALRELLTDPEMCRRLGEAGHRDANERFTWPAVGKKLRARIDEALELSA